jgi:hypothetical protein
METIADKAPVKYLSDEERFTEKKRALQCQIDLQRFFIFT